MPAPALTLAAIAKLDPCADQFAAAKDALPKRRRITAAQARKAGISFDDIVWVASEIARTNGDVERRLRLWLADCAARVLHIYEKTETSDAPRKAIIGARKYARGEIDTAARSAARSAAWLAAGLAAGSAAWSAAWSAARLTAGSAARLTARSAAGSAAGSAEENWQFDRLIAWLSDEEPTDWPLPVRDAKAV